jgi:hypothetical protein
VTSEREEEHSRQEGLREACEIGHGNCAWLDPYQWGVTTCPTCTRPTIVPLKVAGRAGILGFVIGVALMLLVDWLF